MNAPREVRQLSSAARWRHALKVASWPKLLVPALLGQAIGFAASDRPVSHALGALAFGLAFTLADLAYIVLLNDWGDREVDAIKRRMFPRSCSPKTIPDGILPATRVLGVGLAAGLTAGFIAALAGAVLDLPMALPAALACLALFWLYTLPPGRLNYRGGGELLEMVGVGVALPWFHAYLQSGLVLPAALVPALAGFCALSGASAVASGLSDERSDRAGGKRTVASVLGNRAARALVELLAALGVLLWLAAAASSEVPAPAALAAASVAALFGYRMRRLSGGAVTDAFAAQGRYKQALHRGIWWGGVALAAGLVAFR